MSYIKFYMQYMALASTVISPKYKVMKKTLFCVKLCSYIYWDYNEEIFTQNTIYILPTTDVMSIHNSHPLCQKSLFFKEVLNLIRTRK